MFSTSKVRPYITRTNVVTDDTSRRLLTTGSGYCQSVTCEPTLVLDNGGGYQLPEADAYARRQADRAAAFLEFALDRSRMQKQTLILKSLHSLAFTLRHGCNGFCVPSKAVATAKPRRQKALWKRVGRLEFGTRLDVEEVTVGKRIRLVLSHEGDDLGEVQLKWLPVIRPLLPWGTGIRVVRITGHENEHYRLGLNICFTHLTSSIEALQRALGTDIGREGYGSDRAAHTAAGGDGYSDDEADCLPSEVRPAAASTLANHAGDGATAPVELDGNQGPEVIRFWRDERGILRMNIPHVQKHSPSGPEVGYRGSGPADAALSVLCAVTSWAEAERYYQLYKDEVIANMGASGETISRSEVQRWLSSMRSE